MADAAATAQPRELGGDGRFGIERNAMGVPGLHLAYNCFAPEVCGRLYQHRVFTDHAQDFVRQSDGPPLRLVNLHPLLRDWPDDWHRVMNAVRESGLFPQAAIPDSAYGLTYPAGSNFPCHWDSRSKWGEYVIAISLGQRSTLTFQHVPNAKTPFDPAFDPPSQLPPDTYYTASYVHAQKKSRYQVSMTLPPNSIYVMSAASRVDWRHGVRSWHAHPPRRAIIYRSTKVYSEVVLQRELGLLRAAGETAPCPRSVDQIQPAKLAKRHARPSV
jgi:alkylated DNA repair dioxygenase AlkB